VLFNYFRFHQISITIKAESQSLLGDGPSKHLSEGKTCKVIRLDDNLLLFVGGDVVIDNF